MDNKMLRNCKIAVCLSGQSRTFKHCAASLKRFYSTINDNNNEYYFFGHTWGSNDYKVKMDDGSIKIQSEKLFIPNLKKSLIELFEFSGLKISEDLNIPVPKHCLGPHVWGHLFYSAMMANYLKQKYEIENNMMFDLVIKSRFDLCYRPNDFFENYFLGPLEEKTLYSYYGLMRPEGLLPTPDDVHYYGSSHTMDLVDGMYNNLHTGALDKILSINSDNLPKIGPGILMYKWMTIKNILPKYIGSTGAHSVYRTRCAELGLTPEENFDEIKKREYFAEW
jgi:hypothetical protein